jgi:hypothetical protein
MVVITRLHAGEPARTRLGSFGTIELAFRSYPFMRVVGAFDTILEVTALGRQIHKSGSGTPVIRFGEGFTANEDGNR